MACISKKPVCEGPLGSDTKMCLDCKELKLICGEMLVQSKKNVRDRRGSIVMLGLNQATGKELQAAWNTRLDAIVTGLFRNAFRATGKEIPETGWCFCVSGSGARQEACPYSDLDCFILVDEASPGKLELLRNAAKKMNNILFAIDEDGTLDLGIRFCYGGLNPLGKGTESNPELIGTPAQIASIMEKKGVDIHVATGLGESRGLTGDIGLHDLYRLEVEAVRGKSLWAPLSRPSLPYRQRQALVLIEKGAKAWKKGLTKDTKEVDIKIDVYRIPQTVLGGLAMYYDVKNQNSFKIVEALYEKDKFGTRARVAFNTVLEVVAKFRISAHLVHGGEVDTLTKGPARHATELNEQEWKELLSCSFHLEYISNTASTFCENKKSFLKENRTNPFKT